MTLTRREKRWVDNFFICPWCGEADIRAVTVTTGTTHPEVEVLCCCGSKYSPIEEIARAIESELYDVEKARMDGC